MHLKQLSRGFLLAALTLLAPTALHAETKDSTATAHRGLPDWFPNLSGTIRAKVECQTEQGESRFEVRTARLALDGKVTDNVIYKAEIDLSDEGRIRMLDAYGGMKWEETKLLLGQMRVPFSIDAHRSPHLQYFANRSFIAKQVGNVRDVGLCGAYEPRNTGLKLEAGLFNGSGLTDQKDYWTRSLNFSAKAQYKPFKGLTLQASVQKISPKAGKVWLYDGGATLNIDRWTLEAEYLRKVYAHNAFPAVNAVDAFVCYDLPLKKTFRKMSFLCRFDAMGDHADGEPDENGNFKLTDGERKRLTGGITLSMGKKMNADIRINYEKYFYKNDALAKRSERDKAVIELVLHFPNK